MFAPIRPRPMNPMRIAVRPPWRRGPPRAPVRAPPARRPGRRRGGPAGSAGRATRWREVAGRLGVDELAERVRPAGDLEVGRVVRGQLEEPADRRAALVELAGRVEEARAVAGRRRPLGRVAQQRPDPGDGVVACRGRGDERLEREIRVRAAAGEVAGQLPDDVADARGEPERRVAVEGQAVAARDRLGLRSRRSPLPRPGVRRGARGSAPWPPRRWAGRTGRCRGWPRRTRWRPPSGRTRRRDRSGR